MLLFAVSALLLAAATYFVITLAGKRWVESFGFSCFFLLALSLVALMIRRLQDRRQAGPVLLDLGPAPPLDGSNKFVIVSQFLLGMFFLILGWNNSTPSYTVWLAGVLILAPMATLMRAGCGYQICASGPFLAGMLIKWSNIRRFEWEGWRLWIRSSSTLIRFSDCRIKVSEDQKDAVDELLRTHVNDVGSNEP